MLNFNLVSKKNFLDDCLFATNSEGVKFSDLNMRYSGFSALDLAYVASGRLDGFFHNKINIWDVAAGVLLVQEAGGIDLQVLGVGTDGHIGFNVQWKPPSRWRNIKHLDSDSRMMETN